VSYPGGTAVLSKKPYTIYKVDDPRKRKRRRVLLSILVPFVLVAMIVGAYYAWIAWRLNDLDPSSSTTSTTGVDAPESTDILVIGADKRPNESDEKGRSDTLMLVHVDKERDYLSLLSLPRDLYVGIEGHGTNRLNAAYAFGGWELTEATVEHITGVNIEKVIIVDFQAFSDLTDAIGGVYIDVDRSYNSQDARFELISLHPGYQLLKGSDALDYVRFRHDDEGDFGRMLRQQRFINAARDQAMGWNLITDFNGMVGALLENTAVWELDAGQILSLAWWGVHLQGSQIKQVSLVGDITYRDIGGDRASVVVATDEAIDEAVQKLLTPPGAAAAGESQPTSTVVASSTSATSAEIDRSDFTTDLDAIPNSGLWKKYAAQVAFQLMAPGWLPDGYRYEDRYPRDPGSYDILDSSGDVQGAAMKMVYRFYRGTDKTDQYLGLMQTNWLDAPARGKGREVTYNGTTFTVVGTDQHADRVWWVDNGVLYWVSNTLSYYLSSKDLLKMAESMLVVSGE
jgi:polyisoprenyl-teichoic acid--peptidoglycan teichoic acid transferase